MENVPHPAKLKEQVSIRREGDGGVREEEVLVVDAVKVRRSKRSS
jgi:hypothetical protein